MATALTTAPKPTMTPEEQKALMGATSTTSTANGGVTSGDTSGAAGPTTTAPSTGLLGTAATVQNPTAPAEIKPTITPEQTVQGQLKNVLAEDSPVMQQARTEALQQANRRGLLNSSMAAGAATDAVVRSALPIAQQDASSQFSSQQNAVQRNFQERMTANEQANANNRFNAEQQNLTARFGAELAATNNRFDRELMLKSDTFNAEQLNADRRMLAQFDQQLKELGIRVNADKQNIPTNFAANIANSAMQGVNAILGDPNLDPGARSGAIANVVNYANSQIAWAERFYGTAIPRISSPV